MITGKNIVLTGCNSGIGLEVLKLLIKGGNNILCVDKDIDVLSSYEGEKVFVMQKDVSSKEAVDEIFKVAETPKVVQEKLTDIFTRQFVSTAFFPKYSALLLLDLQFWFCSYSYGTSNPH